MNVLTVDLGNSRCKLRCWEISGESPPRLLAAEEFAAAPGLDASIVAWIEHRSPIDAAAMCSVAAAAAEAEVERAFAEIQGKRPGARLETHPDPGLAIACREPARVGRDRLFAARAALERCGGDAIVVDAGTALTVDAVRADSTFLGGAIAPGPRLLATSLAAGTARLPLVDPRPNPPALGRDTEEALSSGVGIGFRGAAKELVERVAEESGLRAAPVVVTGGARAFLLDPSAFGDRTMIVEPELVHLGLLRGLRPNQPHSSSAARSGVRRS